MRGAENDRVGRWLLVSLLGQGAFGTTWLARDHVGREAAIKLLEEMPANELRALSGLCHPCIPAVLDAGGSPPFLAMERAHGRDLTAVLAGGAMPERLALQLAVMLFDALAVVHQSELTHGDIKPDNLLVQLEETPRLALVDFGLSGTSGGTPAYSAPERAAGGVASGPGDVYSAALVLWEMLHGEPPGGGLWTADVLLQRRSGLPPATVGPEWCQALLASLLDPDPEARPTAAEAADVLAASGVARPAVDGALLTRRARVIHVGAEPHVTDAHDRPLALIGPPGSGKSHALDRMETDLLAQGRPTLRVEGDGQPWGAIRATLERLKRTLPSDFTAASTESERTWTLVEELREATGSEWTLLVDDLDTLEPASRSVFEALAELDDGPRVVISAEIAGAWPGDRAQLTPLSEDDTRKMLDALLGAVAPDALVEAATRFSGGWPGATVALCCHAVDAGALVVQAGTWRVDAGALAGLIESGIPTREPSLDLSPGTLKLAEKLAVAGYPLPCLDRSRPAVVELIEHGLVILQEGTLRLARGSLVASLVPGPARARAIHARLLAVLLKDRRANPARIARHIVGASDAPRAEKLGASLIAEVMLRDPLESARLADGLWALSTTPEIALARARALVATGRWEEAMALITATPESGWQGQALLARIHTAFRGEHAAALACVEAARAMGSDESIAMAEVEAIVRFRSGDAEGCLQVSVPWLSQPAPAAPEALDSWLALRLLAAQARYSLGQPEEALRTIEALPADLGEGRPARAVLDAARGRLLWAVGKLKQAQQLLGQAAERGAGLPALERARALFNQGAVLYQLGKRPETLDAWEQAHLLFTRLGASEDLLRADTNLCVGYREAGRWERAREAGERAVAAARERGMDALEAMTLGNLGDLALALSDFDEARRRYDQAQVLAEQASLTSELVELARRRAELALLEQDPDAEEVARRAVATAADAKDAIEGARSSILVAVAKAITGDSLDLNKQIDNVTRILVRAKRTAELARVRVWAAEAYYVSGQLKEADFLVDRALAWAREVGHAEIQRYGARILDGIDAMRPPAKAEASLVRVLELAGSLSRESRHEPLLEKIAAAALELLHADRAFVIFGESPPQVAVSKGEEKRGSPSWTIVDQCISEQCEVISADLGERPELFGESIAAMSLRAVMCVPLMDGEDAIGAIYVDSQTESQADLRRSGHVMRTLASLAAMALSRTRLVEKAIQTAALTVEVAERRRTETELRSYADRMRQLNKQLDETNGRLQSALVDARAGAEAKGRFLAVMSHELRTPLNGVLGMVESLEQTRLDDDQRDQLGLIQVSGAHLLTLINQVLTFSKLEAGQTRIDLEPFSLLEVVEQTLMIVGGSKEAEGLALASDVDPALWVDVEGSPGWLRQILVNLVGNAVRHTPSGHVRVSATDIGGGWARFEVSDTGVGIAPERIPTLFSPFVQGEPGQGRAEGGTGLGLTIARELVQLQGGELRCDSTLGVGSTFWFELPLPVIGTNETALWLSGRRCAVVAGELLSTPLRRALTTWGAELVDEPGGAEIVLTEETRGVLLSLQRDRDHTGARPARTVPLPLSIRRLEHSLRGALEDTGPALAQAPPEQAPEQAPEPTLSASVMVVDDHPVNRAVMKRLLTSLGCEVILAASGAEALDRVALAPPTLVLMDCQMPEMDGYETSRRLLSAGGAWADVPVVALTAHVFEGERLRCLEAGMREVATKPISRKDLADLVDRYTPAPVPVKKSA